MSDPRAVPRRLRVNGRTNAVGIADTELRLQWDLDAVLPEGSALIVTLTPRREMLGRGEATFETALPPSARALTVPHQAHRILWWRVGTRLDGDIVWSEPHRIVTTADYALAGAQWIGSSAEAGGETTWFSRELQTHELATILVHIATPGVIDLRVDGRSTSRSVLAPGYAKHGEFPSATFDLGMVAPGPHRITAEIAAGPFHIEPCDQRYAKYSRQGPTARILALIEVVINDEVAQSIPSDASFLTGCGPTVSTNWYGGEDFDASRPEPWESTGIPATELARADDEQVWVPQHPPIEVVDTLRAITTWPSSRGTVLDFGRNIAGFPRIRWSPSSHDRLVALWPSELCAPDGIDQTSTGSPIYDTARLPAGSSGSWRPRFGYHGFRYLEVVCDGPIPDVVAEVAHATNEQIGEFTSSDAFLSRLHVVIQAAVRGNMFSVFTDCPHREKLGWLEQLHLCFGTLARAWDVEAHLRSVLHHVRQAQLEDGRIPNIAPELVDFTGFGFNGDNDAFRFDVNWGGVIVLLPWYHYLQYGDRRVLEENVASMRRYLDQVWSRVRGGLIDFGLGDWIALDPRTPRALVASYGLLRILHTASSIASAIADPSWDAELVKRTQQLDAALAEWSVSPSPSQTELTLLTVLAEERGDHAGADGLFARWLARFEADGSAFLIGEISLPPLLEMLSKRGLDELILRTIRRTDVPGYGMQLSRGATALTETWSTERGPEGEGSNNHFMLGMIDHWLNERVAGLRQASGSVAWRQAIIEPAFLETVDSAASVHLSPAGSYRSAWRRTSSSTVAIDVTVPPAGSATILLPGIPEVTVGAGQHKWIVTSRETKTAART